MNSNWGGFQNFPLKDLRVREGNNEIKKQLIIYEKQIETIEQEFKILVRQFKRQNYHRNGNSVWMRKWASSKSSPKYLKWVFDEGPSTKETAIVRPILEMIELGKGNAQFVDQEIKLINQCHLKKLFWNTEYQRCLLNMRMKHIVEIINSLRKLDYISTNINRI